MIIKPGTSVSACHRIVSSYILVMYKLCSQCTQAKTRNLAIVAVPEPRKKITFICKMKVKTFIFFDYSFMLTIFVEIQSKKISAKLSKSSCFI